jgi:hypothetical protein
MSAMKVIDEIRDKGGKMLLFESFCGGLVAQDVKCVELYKFTWAPRNVVLAGQGGTANLFKRGLINIYPTVNYLEERSFSKWKDMVDLGLFK